MTLKTCFIKEKNDKFDFTKVKNFSSLSAVGAGEWEEVEDGVGG